MSVVAASATASDCELLCLVRAVTPRDDLGERRSPQHLRADVVLRGRTLAGTREPLRLDVPALLVEDMGERRRDRRAQLVLSDRFQLIVTGDELALGRLQVARHLLDPCRDDGAGHVREAHPELLEDRVTPRVEGACLVWPVGHREQVPAHAEERGLDPAHAVCLLQQLGRLRERIPTGVGP